MKLSIRFFLSLVFILLCGTSFAAHEGDSSSLQGAIAQRLGHPGFYPVQNNFPSNINSASSAGRKNKCKINVAEDEDEDEQDEPVSLKKYLAGNTGFAAFYYPASPEYLCCNAIKHVSFCRHSFQVSSCKYILFRAIRI